MSKAKVNSLEKKVAASVALQYVLEAKMLHMSLSSYIRWLKAKANYSTPYDQMLLADTKAQNKDNNIEQETQNNQQSQNTANTELKEDELGGDLYTNYDTKEGIE